MPNPFEFVKSINEKEYLYEEVDKKSYSAYIINKALSFFSDTIFLANEINKYGGCDPSQHYDFLYHSVPKRRRYSKWFKSNKYDVVDLLCEHYNLRQERALEIVNVLSDSELQAIKADLDKGGK